jgi:arsenate reductase
MAAFLVWREDWLRRNIIFMGAIIYHNPSCQTSRKVLGFLRDAGIEPKIILYLKEPLTAAAISDLLKKLKLKPRDLLRKRGTPYDELGLGDKNLDDAALIAAMVKDPILIERPIVVTEKGAVLCRPPERVNEILPQKQPAAKAAVKKGK